MKLVQSSACVCFHAGAGATDSRRLWPAAALAVLALLIGMSHCFMADVAAVASFGVLLWGVLTAKQATAPGGSAGRRKTRGQTWTLTLIKSEFTQGAWQGAGCRLLVPGWAE